MTFRFSVVLLGAAATAAAQFSGPAILSRGEAPAAISPSQIRFAPTATVGAVYDTGLAGIAVTDAGQLATRSSFGWSLSWGISGIRSWRHTRLGLSYTGMLTRYTRDLVPNSTDQQLMIGITHQFSPHIALDLRQTAGVVTRNYLIGGLAETVPFDPAMAYVPTTDFFDNRNIYTTSSAALTYLWTRRLSFNFSGMAFLTHRDSHALSNAWGTDSRGDFQYRLSARSTIGATYAFQHFNYEQFGGGTDAHSAAGGYSVRLTRRSEFSASGGVARVETKLLQQSAIDPAIAALLGITQTVQVRYTIGHEPIGMARLSRALTAHGVAYIEGGRSISPGNGLFLTSMMTSLMGGYNFTGRKWSMNAQVGYVASDSQGTIAGAYGNITENVSIGRRFGRYLSAQLRVSSRDYRSSDYTNYNRRITTAYLSVGFSPGEVRLPAW